MTNRGKGTLKTKRRSKAKAWASGKKKLLKFLKYAQNVKKRMDKEYRW